MAESRRRLSPDDRRNELLALGAEVFGQRPYDEVRIDEIAEREGGGLTDIHASVVVERDSQKAIIIGRGGSRLREVGTTARVGIEELLGQKVFLDLHVKVAKDWQRDPKQLQRLGF